MKLDKIIAIGGRPGLFQVEVQTRTGVVATSLVDGKRINANARNQVSLLSEINIYGLEKEVPLSEVLQMIYAKEEGKVCAVVFSYFDPVKEEYITLSSKEKLIDVYEGPSVSISIELA